MRTITGLVGRTNRENYKVNTTVATIGIRGTEYSVTYGNSINVTTGEGIVEVCNAAGCLIVNSGETAYVPDSNTRPAMTDKKAEIPPPPVQEGQLPGFVSGNDTTSDGTPSGLTSLGLTSGPGYSLAAVGVFDGSSDIYVFDGLEGATSATFSGGGLAAFSDTYWPASITQGTPVGMLTDGIIGWGRWIDGTIDDEGSVYAMQHVHYVVGMPTPMSDMSALQLGNVTATYSLQGYTYPTAWDSYTSTFTIGTQPITGSLTANFGTTDIMGALTVPIGANVYSTSWSGSIFGAQFSGYDSMNVTSTGGECSACTCSTFVEGFFAGANASRAGLVYEISGTNYGDIHGAAVFKK